MNIKKLDEFNESDLSAHRALKLIINKAGLELRGDTVKQVAMLLSWYDELGGKIEYMAKKEKKAKDDGK